MLFVSIPSRDNRSGWKWGLGRCRTGWPMSVAGAVKRLLRLLSRPGYATVDGDGSGEGVCDGAAPTPDARLSTLRKELVEKA